MSKLNAVLAAGLVAATSSFALLSQVPAFAQNTSPAANQAPPAMSQPAMPTAPQAQSTVPAKPAPQRHAALSRQRIERVQQALNNAGDKIAVDGKWGPKTAAAVKQFQQQHGLKASGRLDQATMKQLHATG